MVAMAWMDPPAPQNQSLRRASWSWWLIGSSRTSGRLAGLDLERVSEVGGPGEDGGRYDPAAVGQGVLVVAGGQGPPLLEDVEAAFDDVAAGVLERVVGHRPAAARAPALAVPGLVVRLRDDGLDAAAA